MNNANNSIKHTHTHTLSCGREWFSAYFPSLRFASMHIQIHSKSISSAAFCNNTHAETEKKTNKIFRCYHLSYQLFDQYLLLLLWRKKINWMRWQLDGEIESEREKNMDYYHITDASSQCDRWDVNWWKERTFSMLMLMQGLILCTHTHRIKWHGIYFM